MKLNLFPESSSGQALKILIFLLMIIVFSVVSYAGGMRIGEKKAKVAKNQTLEGEINNFKGQLSKDEEEKNNVLAIKKGLEEEIADLEKQIADEEQDEVVVGVEEVDISDWIFYEDKESDISFKYPPKWGEVIKEIVDTFHAANPTRPDLIPPRDGTYEYVKIYFSNINPSLFVISFTTPDFKSVVLGEPPWIWNGFTGGKEDFICDVFGHSKDNILNCNKESSSLPTLSYYFVKIFPNSDIIETVKHFKIFANDLKYKGIAIDMLISDLNAPSEDYFVGPDITLEGIYGKYKSEVLQKLNENEKIISKIKELDIFVNSFSIQN